MVDNAERVLIIPVHGSFQKKILLFKQKSFALFCISKGKTGLFTDIDALYCMSELSICKLSQTSLYIVFD